MMDISPRVLQVGVQLESMDEMFIRHWQDLIANIQITLSRKNDEHNVDCDKQLIRIRPSWLVDMSWVRTYLFKEVMSTKYTRVSIATPPHELNAA